MIKALFLDLDGTLLNAKKEISPITRKTLEKCKENKIKLFINTGRPPLLDKTLSWDDNTLALFDGGSYYNGGCVILDGQKIYAPISNDIVRQTINHVCRHDNLNIALQFEDEKHAFRFPLSENGLKRWGVSADEVLTIEQIENLQAVMMLIFYSSRVDAMRTIDKGLVDIIEDLCHNAANFYVLEQGKCVQIMGYAVNKLSGVEKIRSFFGYEKNEIVVFGDDVNDVEMLSEYEHSVAMANAENYVKAKAHYITLDNNNDGIHHAICNIFHLVEA